MIVSGLQVTKTVMGGSNRASIDQELGPLGGSSTLTAAADRSDLPLRSSSPASPATSTFRLADRGIMSGGNQYDALPMNEPTVRTTLTDVSMSGGGGDMMRSTSAQGQKKVPSAGGNTGELSNAKLALNQSVSRRNQVGLKRAVSGLMIGLLDGSLFRYC
jgi:hypothetical protein